jgi:hypothetical protein
VPLPIGQFFRTHIEQLLYFRPTEAIWPLRDWYCEVGIQVVISKQKRAVNELRSRWAFFDTYPIGSSQIVLDERFALYATIDLRG